MKSYLSWTVIILILVLGLTLGRALFEFIPQSAFRDIYLAPLVSTLVGVVLGILLGLNFDRWKQQQEKSSRKRKIITLLRKELEINRDVLKFLVEEQQNNPKVTTDFGLKDELWKTLSNSGDLQWVDDPDLLDSLASAYHAIARIVRLEYEYYDPSFNQDATEGNRSTYTGERAVNTVISLRPDAYELVVKALDMIARGGQTRTMTQIALV